MGTENNLKITRRDFLKLAASLSLTPLAKKSKFREKSRNFEGSHPNIIFLILDTLTAQHLSLYGYPRNTSPNIDRFAEFSTVFHNHHSTANFTTPSTASLLTGTYPWQHRAYTLKSTIRGNVVHNNIFRYLRHKYHTIAFTQNLYADRLLFQFERYLDLHPLADSFNFTGNLIYNHLPGDEALYGLRAYEQFMIKKPPRGSLLMSLLNDFIYFLRFRYAFRDLAEFFPIGMPALPSNYAHFTMSKLMDGVISLIEELQSPFFSYIHLLPPHSPYRPNINFHKKFKDGWNPPATKRHPLGDSLKSDFLGERQTYDEFIANIDYEFGKLLDYLDETGLLENSFIILTSDHGELFERGHQGHNTPLLFEPLLRIPLIISSPRQENRRDIYTNTSSIDILPTLLQIAKVPISTPIEGLVLPFEEKAGKANRNVWAMEAKNNSTFGPLNEISLALFNRNHKLIYYQGYESYNNRYELYDLFNDPFEVEDRYLSDPVAAEMRGVMDTKFSSICR